MVFSITAKGHPNISGTHKTTIEITTEDHVTPRGDCIIGICADRSMRDLPEEMKKRLKKGAEIKITLECNGLKEVVHAKGGDELSFSDPNAIIIRKSDWQDKRTLAINADKASCDLCRGLIKELQKGKGLKITIEV